MEEERETEGWKWIDTIEGVGEGRKGLRDIEGSEMKGRKWKGSGEAPRRSQHLYRNVKIEIKSPKELG